MTVNEHAENWMGYPVKNYLECLEAREALDYEGTVYRIASEYDSELVFADIFRQFADHPDSVLAPGIIIGSWMDDDSQNSSAGVVQLLVEFAARFPRVRGIFFGDIICEENEVSWIQNDDISPVINAFPQLETLRIRGTNGLVLGRLNHKNLKALAIESGGLGLETVKEVINSRLPQLEDLELWLGSENYGADTSVKDLAPFMDPARFPKLRRLALCNSEYQDEIAAAVASSAILPQLEELSLSDGVLSDTGAHALLHAASRMTNLKGLDLHHHYMSKGMMELILRAFPFAQIHDHEEDSDPDDRYISLSE